MEGLDFGGILGEAEVNAIFSESDETTEKEVQETTSEEEIKIIELLKKYTNKDRKLSKYQSCEYLSMSRANFDKYIREGKIPKGKKEAGFKELFWKESELRELYLHKNK